MSVKSKLHEQGVLGTIGNIAKDVANSEVGKKVIEKGTEVAQDVASGGVGGAVTQAVTGDAAKQLAKDATQGVMDAVGSNTDKIKAAADAAGKGGVSGALSSLTKPKNLGKLAAGAAVAGGAAGLAGAVGNRVGNVGRKRGQMNENFLGFGSSKPYRWKTDNDQGKDVEDALWNQGGARYRFDTANGPMTVTFYGDDSARVPQGEGFDVVFHNFDNAGGETTHEGAESHNKKIMVTILDIAHDFADTVDRVYVENDKDPELELKFLRFEVPQGLADEADDLQRFGRRRRFRVTTKQQRYGIDVVLTK